MSMEQLSLLMAGGSPDRMSESKKLNQIISVTKSVMMVSKQYRHCTFFALMPRISTKSSELTKKDTVCTKKCAKFLLTCYSGVNILCVYDVYNVYNVYEMWIDELHADFTCYKITTRR